MSCVWCFPTECLAVYLQDASSQLTARDFIGLNAWHVIHGRMSGALSLGCFAQDRAVNPLISMGAPAGSMGLSSYLPHYGRHPPRI